MQENELKILWQNYKRTKDKDLWDKLIIEYAPLVKIVAGRMMLSMGNFFEMDDLCSIGTFGLIDAIEKFDITKDIKFETYASQRIRGSILDEIRKHDTVSRTVREKEKIFNQKEKDLREILNRQPTSKEIQDALGWDDNMFQNFANGLAFSNTISYEEHIESNGDIAENAYNKSYFISPEENVQKNDLKKSLENAITQLSEKEKIVITLIYYEELTNVEISKILNVSESRVSQIHSKALLKMKPYLEIYKYI